MQSLCTSMQYSSRFVSRYVNESVMYLRAESTFVAFVFLAFCSDIRASSKTIGIRLPFANILFGNNNKSLGLTLSNDDGSSKVVKKRIAAIDGGNYAHIGQFPWMANIHHIRRNGNHLICGGTIISSWWILTAAHCLAKRPPRFLVILGDPDTNGIEPWGYSGNGYARMASEILIYPGYTANTNVEDVGLIRMPEEIPFNDYIQPIRLAGRYEASKNFAGTIATILGWGRELPRQPNSHAKTLKYTSIPIISNNECGLSWHILDSHMCTSTQFGADTCPGDSGGPLVIESDGEFIQIGITSAGSSPCATGAPGIFTRISSYASWIQRVTRTHW